MGHKVGWLTLNAGMAGGADIILIPEIPYDINKVIKAINEREARLIRLAHQLKRCPGASEDRAAFRQDTRKIMSCQHTEIRNNAEIFKWKENTRSGCEENKNAL